MKDCLTASTEQAPLNPTKRVNYNFGMVLGVDDFCQEQVHFEWKHRISNRLLHGFGTVSGLRVTVKAVTNPSDVQVHVSAGYGVSREGKWMWVDQDLCGQLGKWLQAYGGDSSPPLGMGRHTLYVTLCYAECPTHLVPIAGQPCASDKDTRAPSRVQEAYQVEFSWDPPPRLAEDVVQAFGDLMAQVKIVPDGTGSPPVDDGQRLLDAVRALAEMGEGLASPPSMDMGPFQLPASTAGDTIRQALVVWVTEVSPCLYTPLKKDEKDCILLASIDFDVDANGKLDFVLDPEGYLRPGSVEVRSCERPVLVPDWLRQGLCLTDDHLQYLKNGDSAGGDLKGKYPNPFVRRLQGRKVAMTAPTNGQALIWSGEDNRWQPGNPQVAPHYHSEYARSLHTHEAVGGNFVHAPAGPYAIVAAGYFKPDGTTKGTSYNGLEARPEGTGRYRLWFPLYEELLGKDVTYIVKGTIVDPSLSSYEEYLNLYEIQGDPFEYLYDPDKPAFKLYNPDSPSVTPATFQVVELGEDGILVWITQPRLRYGLFKALAREEIDDMGDDMNVILFTPVDKAFMVEISAYGLDPDFDWNEYLSTYLDRVSINTASVEDLRSLPRIGPALAGRIVELRDEVGSFTSIDQLKDVKGIDEFLVSRLRHLMKL